MKKLNLPKLRSKGFVIKHYHSLLRSVQTPMDSQFPKTPKLERSLVIDYHGD